MTTLESTDGVRIPPSIRDKRTRLGIRGRPPVLFSPTIVVAMRNQRLSWKQIAIKMRDRLQRMKFSERTAIRVYKSYVSEHPECVVVHNKPDPVAWWLIGYVGAVRGHEASIDGQQKRCKRCLAWRSKKGFHIASRKADGTAYLRKICNVCYRDRKKHAAEDAMNSIYEGPEARRGPPVKVTRPQLIEAYTKYGTWRLVAEKLGVTEQTVYRVKKEVGS